jgi:type II secretory pathway pseudopilin PulG
VIRLALLARMRSPSMSSLPASTVLAGFFQGSSRFGLLQSRRFERAYSTPEIMIIVAVIGIVAAIGISVITGTVQSSKYNTASANLELLNGAVRQYAQAVNELTNSAGSGISDETAVFAELQADGSLESRPGSPYLQPNLSVRSSSDSESYRAFWNGHEFELLDRGESGTGLDLLRLQ